MTSIPLNIDWQQILLHLLNFVLLAFGLYFLLYKPIKNFMDKRSKAYQDMKDEAEEKVREANALNAEYTAKMQAAAKEIEAERLSSEKETAERNAAVIAEADAKAAKIVRDAELEAKADHDRSVADAKREIADIAVQAVEKLVLDSVPGSYDEFLKYAERSGENAEE